MALSDCRVNPCSMCVDRSPVLSEDFYEVDVTCGSDDYDSGDEEETEGYDNEGDDEERDDAI